MKTLRDLLNILQRTQTKSLLSVTSATVVSNAMGFVLNLLAAKTLGRVNFGLFSLAYSVATMTATIGEVGLNITMIRLFNKYEEDRQRQAALLGSVLVFKAFVLLLIALTSLPLGRTVARGLGVGANEGRLFTVALVTGGILLFWNYVQAFLQSHRSFIKLTVYLLAHAAIRLVCLAVNYAFWSRSPLTWLVATYTVPIIILSASGFLPQIHVLGGATVKHARTSLRQLCEALRYSKWVSLSTIAYASLLSVVQFILSVQTSPAEVGIFSAGITFTMAFSMLNTALRAVLFPQVTALNGPQQMNRYLTRLRRLAPYYGITAVLAIGLLAIFQWFVLGQEYRAALMVFLITSAAISLAVFLGLGTMVVHTMMKPYIDAYVNVARVVLMAALAFILVPALRAMGAAIAFAVPVMAGELWMFRYVRRENRSRTSE